MTIKDIFQTSNFKLATFLYARGVYLEAVINSPDNDRQKVFVFRDVPPELLQVFQSGQAEVGVFAFTAAQDTLRDKLRKK